MLFGLFLRNIYKPYFYNFRDTQYEDTRYNMIPICEIRANKANV